MGNYVIFVGGVATNDFGKGADCRANDCNGHDSTGSIFLEQAIDLSRALNDAARTWIYWYHPAYVRRALLEEKEDKRLANGVTGLVGGLSPSKDNASLQATYFEVWTHLYNTSTKANVPANQIIPCNTAAEMIANAAALTDIRAIFYFGHSNDTHMLIDYGASVPHQATQMIGLAEMKTFKRSQFTKDAWFVSFGCMQGYPGGLAEGVAKELQPIRSIGCATKTDYSKNVVWNKGAYIPPPSAAGKKTGHDVYVQYYRPSPGTTLKSVVSMGDIPPPFPSP